jgi:DNA polymerase I-like protein with 3'-5' exonuclease and polymerase domains
MPDDPTPALLYRMNQNIMALGSALEEIGIWIDQRGFTNTSDRVSKHLQVLESNTDAIAGLMADLIARCKPDEEEEPED